MQNLREDVFTQLFRAGGIRSATVAISDGRSIISYVTGDGVTGSIYTKRGEVKHYRIETALHSLRQVGFHSTTVDMRGWDLGQALLL